MHEKHHDYERYSNIENTQRNNFPNEIIFFKKIIVGS